MNDFHQHLRRIAQSNSNPDRQFKLFKMRMDGATFREIGEALGMSQGNAQSQFKKIEFRYNKYLAIMDRDKKAQ